MIEREGGLRSHHIMHVAQGVLVDSNGVMVDSWTSPNAHGRQNYDDMQSCISASGI